MSRRTRKDDGEADLLHARVAGLDAVLTGLGHARELIAQLRSAVSDKAWEDLAQSVLAARNEIQALLYEALTFLDVHQHHAFSALVRPEFRRMSPMDIWKEMLPAYQARAQNRNITMEFWDEAGATAGVELEVNGVRQMFHNALTNALKYSYKGSADIYRFIRVTCKRRLPVSGGFNIIVQNYGIGIPDDERDQVWDKGFRGRIAREEGIHGAGLGLTQIRRCMRRHAGTAQLESDASGDDSPYKTTLTLSFPDSNNVRSAFK